MSARPPVVIVGAGFSGLCAAMYLERANIRDYVVLEKASAIGGTWRDNTYPGAACDIPSHIYSYSFAPNPHWSRAYSGQAEILEYLVRCADDLGVSPKVRFGVEVIGAEVDETTGHWRVRTRTGGDIDARALIVAGGPLHEPAIPDMFGLDRFDGPAFHSARWDHDVDLTGKRVAVIGTGASAIQLIPEIVGRVGALSVYQRTPAWVLPKADRPISRIERLALSRVPMADRLYRTWLYWWLEWRAFGFVSFPDAFRPLEWLATRHMHRSIRDPELRAALRPSYRLGCKRILLSNDYYSALAADNVQVVTDPIREIGSQSIRAGQTEVPVDVIIFATGFRVGDYLTRLDIRGLGGRALRSAGGGAEPEAFLGTTVTGFPNLFLILGPNSGLGHNSIVVMIEAQARYAQQCISLLDERDLAWMDVREDIQSEFNRELQRRLVGTVWESGCESWYRSDDGVNRAMWPGTTVEFMLRTRRPDLGHFHTCTRARPLP